MSTESRSLPQTSEHPAAEEHTAHTTDTGAAQTETTAEADTDAHQAAPAVPAAPAAPPVEMEPPAAAETTRSPAEANAPPITLRQIARWLLVLGALYGLGWLLWASWSVLLPFQIGLVLAYLVLPLVNNLNRQMPRWAAILTVYLGGLVVAIGFFGYIVPPLINQINQFIGLLRNVRLEEISGLANEWIKQLQAYHETIPEAVRTPLEEGFGQAVERLQSNLTTYVQELGTFLLTSVLQVVNTVTFLLGFLIVPFWLFYVLKDERDGFAALNNVLPENIRADFWAILRIFNRIFSSYIRGQLLLGLVVGLVAGLGLFILGLFGLEVDSILLLAIIAGTTELIPVIGPVIGAIPAITLGFFDSVTTGVAVTILYVAIQQLENNFLVPRIVGESVGIHPAILMVLLVVLGHAFGLIGIILSAPLAAVVRDTFIYVNGRLSDPPRPAGLLPERASRRTS
ncbi:MAG: AI-2E family transporter [Chloroflexaceae bacterium]